MSRWTKKQDDGIAAVPAAHVTKVTAPEARPRLGDVLLSRQALQPEQLSGALNL